MTGRATLLLSIALIAIVAVAYHDVLSAGFVWLDHLEIVQGALIVEQWSDIPALFASDGNFAGYHRPFYNLLHSFDRAVWGLNPFGFHLSSLVLHALNAVLVLLLARRLELSALASLAVALLWALHPVNTAVAGLIHAKADVFVATMLLATTLLVLRGLRRGTRFAYVLAGIAFCIALLTKELAFAFPLGVTLWAWRETRLRKFAAVTWALTISVWLYRTGVAAPEQHELPIGRFDTLMTFSVVYVDYVRRIFLPYDPSVCDTVTAWTSLPIGERLRWFIGLVVIVAVQRAAWREHPTLRKWIVLFNLSLLPVSQFIVPTLHFRADRFLYLPSLALVGSCVEALGLLRGKVKFLAALEPRAVLAFAITVAGACFFLATRERLEDFESDETLFLEEVAREPDYLEGLSALAAHFDGQGDFERANVYYRECLGALATESGPLRISYLETGSFLVNFSFNLLARNEPERSLELLTTYSRFITHPRAIEQAKYNAAVAEYRLGDFEAALAFFEDYAARHPRDAGCRYLLGVCAKELGRKELARESFRTYLALSPRAPDREQVEDLLAELE